MAEKDALRNNKIESGSGGLFFKVSPGDSAKIRVLTTDPYVTKDKWGNTRFGFVIYNFTEGKAQILSKGPGFASKIQALHNDEDWNADIQKIDLKVSCESTGPDIKDIKYDINPLPKTETLTKDQIAEAQKINLEEVIKDMGARLSTLQSPDDLPENKEVLSDTNEDVVVEDMDEDEPVDLSDIPF